MNCGGVEAALVNLLNRIDYDHYTIDLFLLKAKGEFLDRVNKRVNIIDLSNVINPVQWTLISSENSHEAMRSGLSAKHWLSTSKTLLLYAFYKFSRAEFPAYRAASISRKIADFDYDLILDFHGYSSFTTFFGANILSGKKRMTWCHSQNIIFDKGKKSVNKYNKMFTVSAEMMSLPSLQRLNTPVEVFYNFVDVDKILKQAISGNKLPKTLEHINLLTIGRLSVEKGYDTAIEVAKLLKDSGAEFKWYFCGDGEEKANLVALIEKHDLTKQIIFLGYQANPYGYLSSCDIYVQPSRYEGYAVTLMEAKILHKVIVTTNVSGAYEAVHNGSDGYICNNNVSEIAAKLGKLMTDQQLLATMKLNAQNINLSQVESEKKLKIIFDSLNENQHSHSGL